MLDEDLTPIVKRDCPLMHGSGWSLRRSHCAGKPPDTRRGNLLALRQSSLRSTASLPHSPSETARVGNILQLGWVEALAPLVAS